MKTLQIISLCLGIITGSFTVLTLLCAPFRNWLLNAKKEKAKREEEEAIRKETHKCLLRDRITSTYYQYADKKEIPQYEYENIDRLYKQYKYLGGNSFVDKIWTEIQTWSVIR